MLGLNIRLSIGGGQPVSFMWWVLYWIKDKKNQINASEL